MEIHMYVDADWTGCRASRVSTREGLITVGGITVRTWGSPQGSSGDTEIHALAGGIADGHIDSSAAKAAAGRVGLGKTRPAKRAGLGKTRPAKKINAEGPRGQETGRRAHQAR